MVNGYSLVKEVTFSLVKGGVVDFRILERNAKLLAHLIFGKTRGKKEKRNSTNRRKKCIFVSFK